MTGEKRVKVTITGEMSPEDYQLLRKAIGSVAAAGSLQINATEIKPLMDMPTHFTIPEQLEGHLGQASIKEFMAILESHGVDSKFAVRIWNILARAGMVDRDKDTPNWPSSISNLRNNQFPGSSITTEVASTLGDSVNLDSLTGRLQSGELRNFPNVGLAGLRAYGAVIQHRVNQLLAETSEMDQASPG